MAKKQLEPGDIVRKLDADYSKAPQCVKDLMTYIVVQVNDKTIDCAYRNTVNVWRPEVIKKDNVELVIEVKVK